MTIEQVEQAIKQLRSSGLVADFDLKRNEIFGCIATREVVIDDQTFTHFPEPNYTIRIRNESYIVDVEDPTVIYNKRIFMQFEMLSDAVNYVADLLRGASIKE
jgi:hypothetical protein